ncbi:MAG: YicC family protein [Planctomycetes bacterium]|nr:YicC family protein [Planctomycetota bacterium]
MTSGSIISMTGFGRDAREADGLTVQAEAKSFNQRFLKIVVRLPAELTFLEEDLRRLVSARVNRGLVEVTVKISGSPVGTTFHLNTVAFREHYHEWLELKRDLNIDANTPIEALMKIPDVWSEAGTDDEVLERSASAVRGAVDAALAKLDGMRKKEGLATGRDLLQIGSSLKSVVEKIASLWPDARTVAVDRLKPLLATLLDSSDGSVPQGIEREIVQLADRSDISEELKRLQSHIDQYMDTLSSGGSVGRKLEFVLQEMHREINTISSKSQDAEIGGRVVEAKVLLERGREQVQNVE